MKKSILEIYALLVCLITLVWAVIVVGVGIYDSIRITAPQLTIHSWDYDKYLTNESYLERCCKQKENPSNLSETDVTKKRLEAREIAINEEKRSGLQGLIKNCIALFLNIIIFSIHWKVAKRARDLA